LELTLAAPATAIQSDTHVVSNIVIVGIAIAVRILFIMVTVGIFAMLWCHNIHVQRTVINMENGHSVFRVHPREHSNPMSIGDSTDEEDDSDDDSGTGVSSLRFPADLTFSLSVPHQTMLSTRANPLDFLESDTGEIEMDIEKKSDTPTVKTSQIQSLPDVVEQIKVHLQGESWQDEGVRKQKAMEKFVNTKTSILSKDKDNVVLTTKNRIEGEILSSPAPAYPINPGRPRPGSGLMVGTHPGKNWNLHDCKTVIGILHFLQMCRSHKLMVCDVLPYKHIFFSCCFLWNDDIASMSVVTNWFKFRLEDCVRRIGSVGCVPVIYVVHQDWKTFT